MSIKQVILNLKRNYIIAEHSPTGVGDTVLRVCKTLLVKHNIKTHIVVKPNNILLYYTHDTETFNVIILLLTKADINIVKVYQDHIIIRY